ncbi:MAG TPA: hypothetical protein VF789_19960 [Thermoanaerobaculia bacterium]
MTRKLFLLVGVLGLTFWASAADAIGPCNCNLCFPGSQVKCVYNGSVWTCPNYRSAFC